MAYSPKAKFGRVRELAFGGIGATYVAMAPPFSENARLLYFGNTTNEDLYLALDDATYQDDDANIRLAAHSFQLYDMTANQINDIGFWLPISTLVYVKYASGAPTSGTFWIQEIYGTFS